MSDYRQEIELVRHFANVAPGEPADLMTAKGLAYVSRAVGLMFDGGAVSLELAREIGTALHTVNGQRETEEVMNSGEIDARSFVMGVLFALDNEAFAVVRKRIPF